MDSTASESVSTPEAVVVKAVRGRMCMGLSWSDAGGGVPRTHGGDVGGGVPCVRGGGGWGNGPGTRYLRHASGREPDETVDRAPGSVSYGGVKEPIGGR
ncbi:hypothetical protein GCM10010315_29050 [Streptomyces luteosporeus]|uniref:Uncharacterized protein n=1 Tax=Streptomyces luteosporeus TaxID=173856 RepID=A0ABN3TTQ5_9ACTN